VIFGDKDARSQGSFRVKKKLRIDRKR